MTFAEYKYPADNGIVYRITCDRELQAPGCGDLVPADGTEPNYPYGWVPRHFKCFVNPTPQLNYFVRVPCTSANLAWRTAPRSVVFVFGGATETAEARAEEAYPWYEHLYEYEDDFGNFWAVHSDPLFAAPGAATLTPLTEPLPSFPSFWMPRQVKPFFDPVFFPTTEHPYGFACDSSAATFTNGPGSPFQFGDATSPVIACYGEKRKWTLGPVG